MGTKQQKQNIYTIIYNINIMNVLELYSGTGSVNKICEELGWDCLSLDKDLPADINIDILEWNYKEYPPHTFDIIWASPPCELWSRLQNTWIGRKRKDGTIMTAEIITERINKYGKPLVDKTLEIIDYFKPKYYFIENPATSRMKDYIKLPNYVVSYCKYADWGYRKDTRIWTNIKGFIPKKCQNDCNSIIKKQHKNVLGNGYEIINGKKVLCNTKEKRDKIRKAHKLTADGEGDKRRKDIGKGTNRIDRYRIPPELIRELFLLTI